MSRWQSYGGGRREAQACENKGRSCMARMGMDALNHPTKELDPV